MSTVGWELPEWSPCTVAEGCSMFIVHPLISRFLKRALHFSYSFIEKTQTTKDVPRLYADDDDDAREYGVISFPLTLRRQHEESGFTD